MSLTHIGLIILFLVLLAAAGLVIARSTAINNRMFSLSARLLKGFGEIPNPEGQRESSLWVIRIFCGIIMCVCALFLYFLFSNINW